MNFLDSSCSPCVAALPSLPIARKSNADLLSCGFCRFQHSHGDIKPFGHAVVILFMEHLGKFLEFMHHAMGIAVQFVMGRNARTKKMRLKGTQFIGCTRYANPTLFSLNRDIPRTCGILGANGKGKKAGIGQRSHSRCINSVEAQIRRVVYGFRRTKETDDEVQIVDVDVIQRTAGTLRIKGRKHLALQVFVIAAGKFATTARIVPSLGKNSRMA